MDKIFPNILIFDKNFNRIGTLSIGGANPQAPYYDDLYTQELDTGADTYYFSTMSTPYTQDLLEIGNHVAFIFKNKFETFTITSLEYSHNEGYKTIGVYAEGIGFELLEIFMEKPEVTNNSGSNDSDGDGDDNTDDEYADPDDVYIDENGNIIYDKNGGTDYADEDDVTVDGDGNIIYKRSKNNSKNDTLEFKNISYPTFLNVLLKNTGWSFECQPGLESVKADITVRYDTNIYAILQDSMQAFRGVELEFCYEGTPQSDGTTAILQRVIKSYKDGGRGSFVGKRFEYGTNVRGITKTQEVTDSEDDTILYVDNIGIDVTYDVDFALKSAEIPEIEIGDTHYVIDNDFCPPMNIKARIGKIEISFSDSTRNKIYLANNKKIRGSAIEDEIKTDDIKDVIDDYDNNNIADHDHERLVYMDYKDEPIPMYYMGVLASKKETSSTLAGIHLNIPGNDGVSLDFSVNPYKDASHGWTYCRIIRNSHPDEYNFEARIFTAADTLIPNSNCMQDIGIDNRWWRYSYIDYGTFNTVITKHLTSIRTFSHTYQIPFDGYNANNVTQITDSSNVTKQDLLDFILNDVKLYSFLHKDLDEFHAENGLDDAGNYLGILSEDYMDHNSGEDCTWTSKVAHLIMRNLLAEDTDNDDDWDDEDIHDSHLYNLPSLVCALIGAFQQHVNGDSSNPSNPDNPGEENGDIDLSDYATKEYVDDAIEDAIANLDDGDGGGSGDGCEACLVWEDPTPNITQSKGYRFAGDLVPHSYIDGEVKPLVDRYVRVDDYGIELALKYVTPTAGEGPKEWDEVVNFAYDPDNDGYPTFGPSSQGSPLNLGGPVHGEIFQPWHCIYTESIQFSDGTIMTTAGGSSSGGGGSNSGSGGSVGNVPSDVIEYYSYPNNAAMYLGESWVQVNDDMVVEGNILISGSLVGAGALENIEFLDADDIALSGDLYTAAYYDSSKNTKVYGTVYFQNDIWAKKIYGDLQSSSDKSMKENIRYLDDSVAPVSDDLLEKADLHDFIVNQIDLCEYNFIGDDSNNIGFIANDYEGTKVGDKIVSRKGENNTFTYNVNNLLFSTIGALQEEVRIRDEEIAIRDEEIATLKDRLARIEEMLGINN